MYKAVLRGDTNHGSVINTNPLSIMWKLIDSTNVGIIVILMCFLSCDAPPKEIKEDIKIFYISKFPKKVDYDVYINIDEYFKKNEFSYKSITKSLNIKDSVYSLSLYTEWQDDYPESGCSDCYLIGYSVKFDSVYSYLITESNIKGRYKNNFDWDKFVDCYNCIRTENNNKYPKGYRIKRIINKVVVDSI